MVITQRRIITRTKGTGSRVNIKKNTQSTPPQPRPFSRLHRVHVWAATLTVWAATLTVWAATLTSVSWGPDSRLRPPQFSDRLTEINRCRVSIKETSFISRKLYSPSLPLSLSHVAHLTPTMKIIISCQTVLSVRGTIWSVITTIILLGHCSVY